jgi:hypothetical protein
MASKYMKKCLTSLFIKEMQIKTTFRFYLTPVRMAIIKDNNNKNAGEDGSKDKHIHRNKHDHIQTQI